MPNLVGTEPNQVPVNGMLGTAAFIDAEQMPVSAPQQAALSLKVNTISPVFVPSTSVTPAANGNMVFELTSNTSLTVKVKGSDGTVRSVVLTLA